MFPIHRWPNLNWTASVFLPNGFWTVGAMCDELSNWLVMSIIGLVALNVDCGTPHRHYIMFNLQCISGSPYQWECPPFSQTTNRPLPQPNGRKMPAFGAVQGDGGRVQPHPNWTKYWQNCWRKLKVQLRQQKPGNCNNFPFKSIFWCVIDGQH